MSKSSDALTSGLFDRSMQNAAPILFWSAILLFLFTFVTYSGTSLIPSEIDQTDSETRVYLIFGGLVQGLNNAVWPFTGAAIVWALSQRTGGEAE